MGGSRLRGSGVGHDDYIDGSLVAFLGSSCWARVRNSKPMGIRTPQL